MSAQLPLVVVNRTHLCAQLTVYPVHHVSFLNLAGIVKSYIIYWHKKACQYYRVCRYFLLKNILIRTLYHRHEARHLSISPSVGLLVDDIDVFDFAPGEHTATITVTDILGSSDSESVTFTTPGEYSNKHL